MVHQLYSGDNEMDNFGWSIALVPGTPLIIGDTPDAHIQLQGAYGRAARIALQMDKKHDVFDTIKSIVVITIHVLMIK